ncbi:MAG: hypothetical protein HXX13_14115 [Bacteroidetes bacterium]|nr:hypothetical protein [Bacteroidota bacterium]
MKTYRIVSLLFFLVSILSFQQGFAQADTAKTSAPKYYEITTNDGGEFVGIIISQDAKEVLINTRDRGQISIPKYQVKEIKEVPEKEITATGGYIPAEVFSTRYFITTNGLPIEKKESYILWNLWGPDFEFGVGKNLGVGIMTSWIGMPIIGTVKYTINLQQNVNMAIGGLVGTGSWIQPNFGLALPYAALTFGDRKSNITFSGGYGAVFNNGNNNGRLLFSVAGMAKMGKKVCFVFDSFLVTPKGNLSGGGLILPGIRLQTDSKKAFQFGFGGLYVDGKFIPSPIPYVQWFRKL